MKKRLPALGALTLFAIAALAPAPASAQADFYKNKTVTIVVGTRVGGSIGNTALLVSRHLGKHIPGNPSVIPVNVPGGGGITAANQVAFVLPKDGTILTNLHVVTGAKRFTVTFSDGMESDAVLVAAQPENDLAVIKALKERYPGLKPDTGAQGLAAAVN